MRGQSLPDRLVQEDGRGVATFRESARPNIGMRTRVSARASQSAGRPPASEPTTIAVGPDRSASVSSTSPSGAAAISASDRAAIQARTSAEDAEATGTEKTVPLLARTTFGLPQSVAGSAAITAATPAASAVRRIAPRLPGFSTPSQTKTSGPAPGSSRSRPVGIAGTTASQPSGDSR